MVLGLFVAPLLVGSMMYLVALGNVMVQRESLQQSADSSVLSAAIVSARAMNAISVMNVLMACIMSIILPLRSLLEGYQAAIMFYGALCGPHNQCACKSAADAKRAKIQLEQKARSAEDRAKDLLTALSDAQKTLAETAPRIGSESASRSVERNRPFVTSLRAEVYSPSLSSSGCRLGLPVEEDDFERVCKRAGEYGAMPAIALRVAGPTELDTIGECKSGMFALGIAEGLLGNPTGSICKEKGSSCGGSGPHPKKVYSEAKNGNAWMQYWVELQGKTFDTMRKGVDIAGQSTKTASDIDSALNVGFAQSEIYFDCTGGFSSQSCNGDENAMWNTRWTARLRRVHTPDISFDNDAHVKNVMTNAGHWQGVRSPMMNARVRLGRSSAEGGLQGLLMSSNEGPLQ
jgi:hypothetical protein